MRETKSQEYYEIRDSISRDWLKYFKECLPNCKIIFLPNLGSDITTYIEDWNLNGFILTGGEDFGFSKTTKLLFPWFLPTTPKTGIS